MESSRAIIFWDTPVSKIGRSPVCAGICSRDLKLENILMVDKESNHIKIIDFGLSRFFDRTACDPLATMCGSPQYVAPEILELADTGRKVRTFAANRFASQYLLQNVSYLLQHVSLSLTVSPPTISQSTQIAEIAPSPRCRGE